jgi:tRNA(Ile)-lysidine synthase
LPIEARRHPLIAEVERAMRLRCDYPLEGKLLLGVSGGADSTALLIACAVLRDREAGNGTFQPTVAHVNHHLRDAAEEDARHVRQLCAQLCTPCEVVDIAPGALPGNVSANARRLRYEALVARARSVGAAHVAVAHHAEDQLETVLAAICRGAGLEGAAGMRWSRPLDAGVQLVRPLLGVSKVDCVSLCDAAGIMWREDPTNMDVSFRRARLRRDVLPVLEELWPGAAQRAAATADLLAIAAPCAEARLEEIFGSSAQRSWQRHQLAAHSVPLLTAGLRRAIPAEGMIPQRQIIAAAEAIRDDETQPRTFAIGGASFVRITSSEIRIESA